MVDDDGATRRQADLARVGGFDLVLDLEAREERHIVVIALDAVDRPGHHMRHELTRLFEDIVGIDQDFANIRLKVVTNGADHQATFLVDQEGPLLLLSGALDCFPQLQQVVEIPLQFFGIAADGRRAGDKAHALRHVQLIHYLAQFGALVSLDTARDAAAAGVVRHQYQIAAGETDEGRQRCTLVATLVLINLDDQFLAFAKCFLDRRAARFDTRLEEGAGDFLEGQKAVPFGAVIDECRF
ncbi:MAG: hypothetical protein AW10_00772 [Candidatus Accumulibacter appositus]|uniref:Uncharacterized protein n=1 Tax=Candidatus Accumulibacter appositus TaxID=1454003 RepID=A0A011PYN5_9PROT|nr:MAG: hypothetical protein AW10_00772 [Candidatus Accumulibacter appositus]